jgi:hypothetical protein
MSKCRRRANWLIAGNFTRVELSGGTCIASLPEEDDPVEVFLSGGIFFLDASDSSDKFSIDESAVIEVLGVSDTMSAGEEFSSVRVHVHPLTVELFGQNHLQSTRVDSSNEFGNRFEVTPIR